MTTATVETIAGTKSGCIIITKDPDGSRVQICDCLHRFGDLRFSPELEAEHVAGCLNVNVLAPVVELARAHWPRILDHLAQGEGRTVYVRHNRVELK